MKDIAIVVDKNQNVDIVSVIKAEYVAGKVAVVNCEDDNPTADGIVRDLEKAGYRVKKIVFPKGLIVGSAALSDLIGLDEDVRFVVGVGGRDIAELLKLSERNYLLVMTRLDSVFYLNQYAVLDGAIGYVEGHEPRSVVVSKWQVAGGSSEMIARAYAEIMSLLADAMDMRFSEYYARMNISAAVERIEETVADLIEIGVRRNSADSIDRLIDCNIKLARLVRNMDIANFGLEKMARVAAMDIAMEYDRSELKALWMLYYMEKVARTVKVYDVNLLKPPDVTEYIVRTASMLRVPDAEVYKMLPQVAASTVLARDYVLREYCGEIAGYLDKKLPLVHDAVLNWRRLYDDAGLKLAEKGGYEWLRNSLSAAALCADGYPLIKHMVLLGVA